MRYYALEGLSSLVKHRPDSDQHQPGSGDEVCLRTMFDPRNNLANEVSAQLIEHLATRVRTLIPANVPFGGGAQFWQACPFHTRSRAALLPIWRSPVR